MKKIVFAIFVCGFISSNIYASTVVNETIKDEKLYIEYKIEENEIENFYNNLDNTIKRDNITYNKKSYDVKKSKQEETVEISDIREIISNTNSLDGILNQLPKNIEYNLNGYTGANVLDYNNIEIIRINNGYYEEYVDEVKQYFDLSKNDMSFIPKTINKDGIELYLINVTWYPQTFKNTGEIQIADLYRCDALYRGVKRINNPTTYRVIANYNGTAKKEYMKIDGITVEYEKINNENVQQVKEDNKSNLIVPITATSTGLVILFIFILNTNKVKVYTMQNGKYRYVGKYNIKNNEIDISKNKKLLDGICRIKLTTNLYSRLKNKELTIKNNDISRKIKVENKIFEIKF